MLAEQWAASQKDDSNGNSDFFFQLLEGLLTTKAYNRHISKYNGLKQSVTNNSCRCGTVHLEVVDIGDCLQIGNVAVNVMNKQSQTADKGVSSSFGVRAKNEQVTKCHTGFQTLM